MNDGTFKWKAYVAYGLFLSVFGLFVPEFAVWGLSPYVWALRAGVTILGIGALVSIAPRISSNHRTVPPARKWTLFPVDAEQQDLCPSTVSRLGVGGLMATAGLASFAPMFNVDGTPMMDGGMLDILGKPYGDTGFTIETDFGSVHCFGDSPFSSDMDSMHSSSSDC